MSGPDTSVIHAHSLSSLTALLCHRGLLLQTNWGPLKSGGSRFQQQQALVMLSAFLALCPAKAGADQIKFQNQVCLGGSMVHSSALATEC